MNPLMYDPSCDPGGNTGLPLLVGPGGKFLIPVVIVLDQVPTPV